MNHHYLPQFYLQRWANEEGRVQCMTVKHGKFMVNSHPPKSICCEEGLYALSGQTDRGIDYFEEHHLKQVDDKAAKVVSHILTRGISSLTAEQRKQFAQFLISLLWRHDTMVKAAKDEGQKVIEKLSKNLLPEIRLGLADNIEYLKSNIHMEMIAARTAPSENADVNRYGLSNYEVDAEALLGIHWWVEDFSGVNYKLLTSDHPFISYLVSGVNAVPQKFVDIALDDRRVMSLPLSPTCCFFASKSKNNYRFSKSELVKHRNMITVKDAKKYVYSSDLSQKKFVEKHFTAHLKMSAARQQPSLLALQSSSTAAEEVQA